MLRIKLTINEVRLAEMLELQYEAKREKARAQLEAENELDMALMDLDLDTPIRNDELNVFQN